MVPPGVVVDAVYQDRCSHSRLLQLKQLLAVTLGVAVAEIAAIEIVATVTAVAVD